MVIDADISLLAELETEAERLLENHYATTKEWHPHLLVPDVQVQEATDVELKIEPNDGIVIKEFGSVSVIENDNAEEGLEAEVI